MADEPAIATLSRKDFQSDQEVRWCPGCGDYTILSAIQLLLPELGVNPENMVFVSGIGCAARLPYYMNVYGLHGIHGRAPAIATGVALARPDLEATFVARTHDMDRKHMIEMFRRAHDHQGASFVEVYQNCNVFNDGAFEAITAKEQRADMIIELHHGEPIRFGADDEFGVALNAFGECEIVKVADAGVEALLVHDEYRTDPTLAFALSRLATRPTTPTPMGVFRDVARPTYDNEVQRQLVAASERQGPGDLKALVGSGATWEVV